LTILLKLDSEGVVLALLAESKQTLASLIGSYRENTFSRSKTSYYVPGDMLICSTSETTTGPIDAICINTLPRLGKCIIILQDLSVFCIGKIGELNDDVVGITSSASFNLWWNQFLQSLQE
jgi:hypothetical protein